MASLGILQVELSFKEFLRQMEECQRQFDAMARAAAAASAALPRFSGWDMASGTSFTAYWTNWDLAVRLSQSVAEKYGNVPIHIDIRTGVGFKGDELLVLLDTNSTLTNDELYRAVIHVVRIPAERVEKAASMNDAYAIIEEEVMAVVYTLVEHDDDDEDDD